MDLLRFALLNLNNYANDFQVYMKEKAILEKATKCRPYNNHERI